MLFLFCSPPSFCQGEIVQGPFKIDGDKIVYIQKENSTDFPLGLYYSSGSKRIKVDRYEVDGDIQNIDSLFLIKVNNVKNVIALVSWHQFHQAESINGVTYQVYGYKYNGETLIPNENITNDPELNGMDGEFNGGEVHFKYKDTASIKQYIKNKYK
ncbi:hypothetical protein [Serratia rhizosphaerae]|uniref:hypothetical protein n=1 Tax=Serratia rhizosphaerae TaxID=2597702 RepID=UPI002DB991C8|nr:hypothetical protein [Serratia rhizosphaerae]MEB6335712.1 hypothetical protein [Serratia rhizosphaerae]